MIKSASQGPPGPILCSKQAAGLETNRAEEDLARFAEVMNNRSIPDGIKNQLREQFPELAAAFDQGRG